MKKSALKKIENSVRTKKNEILAPYTTYGVGGETPLMIFPETDREAADTIEILCSNRIPYMILGNGSNILISDKGYPGVVVQFGKKFRKIDINGSIVTVGAMALLWDLVRKCAENGLSGLEDLAGIPGSVGGALYMNAGAYGTEISDKIIKIKGIDKKNCEMHWHDQGAMNFEYRKGPNRMIYLWAEFLMTIEDSEKCIAKIKEINNKRDENQPLNKRSAGCVFKNPEGEHAGKIIDEIGLKGLSYNGAEVSSKHANFIISSSAAKAGDIWKLIKMVKKTVKKYKNIQLETEIILKGEFDGKIYY
ncbi:MAG: UDP-N-acetylmuramate dehydrogenase [Candidatus Zixiibacteriota bacterium]